MIVLPPELIAYIFKIEGIYFFWKQHNRMQKMTKVNTFLTSQKNRVIRGSFGGMYNHVLFESVFFFEIRIPISKQNQTFYLLQRAFTNMGKYKYEYFFFRNRQTQMENILYYN
jgi:hypothetical protein